jgi:hypothetical protein
VFIKDGNPQRMTAASAMALEIEGLGNWTRRVLQRRFGLGSAIPVMTDVHVVYSSGHCSDFHDFTLLDWEVPD